MKIIAVDDEKLALESVISAIKKVKPEESVTGFRDAQEALHFIEENACDVAFLDIEMREMDGITLAKKNKIIMSTS
ncbi:MAG: response regulator [Lachnospiraceae bacterium]|nr:response regulator [Lachnospiraceae bacterium]